MDSPERTAVRRGLDELKPHLATYASHVLSQPIPDQTVVVRGDIQAIIRAMFDNWDVAFRSRLPRVVRSYLHELLDVRNRWAHEEAFSPDDAKRALDTMQQIAQAIGAGRAISPQGPTQADSTARFKTTPRVWASPRAIGSPHAAQTLRMWSAEDLHAEFVKTVNSKRPIVASYSWVYSRLFGSVPKPWSQGHGVWVVNEARRTRLREVVGLGPVALDTFVVGKQTGVPSPGYWRNAPYNRAAWDRVFAGAQLLHGDKRAPWET